MRAVLESGRFSRYSFGMDIRKPSVCGSLQSNDCLVEVMPADTLRIELFSPLEDRFGAHMTAAAQAAAEALGVTGARIRITDKGALDCTIRARTAVALMRASEATP